MHAHTLLPLGFAPVSPERRAAIIANALVAQARLVRDETAARESEATALEWRGRIHAALRM